jgi:exodeoxyribonuclease VIII
METGLYYDLDFKQYRSEKDWVSISELNTYRRAGACYKNEILDGNKRPTSPQQAIGTGVHAAYLEPEVWETQFQCATKIDRRTKEGKLQGEAQDKLALEKGITFLNPDQFNQIEQVATVLWEHPYLKLIRGKFKCEASLFWINNGVKCKGRVDSFSPDLNTIFDVKTTKDAKNFSKSIIEYGYHRQAAYYLDGLTAVTGEVYDEFVWICVEVEAPYLCALYKADKTMLEIGRQEYQSDLLQFAESKAKNEWLGLPTTVETISLPSWYVNKTTDAKL